MNNIKAALVATVGGTLAFVFYMVSTDWMIYQKSPKRAYFANEDFNKDGYTDLIVENFNGDKIPLYRSPTDSSVYLRASEMPQDSIVKIDYESIEKKLNER